MATNKRIMSIVCVRNVNINKIRTFCLVVHDAIYVTKPSVPFIDIYYLCA